MSKPLSPSEAHRTSADTAGAADTADAASTLAFIELSEAAMDALIQRVQTAIADDLALSKSDLQLIQGSVHIRP